MENIENIVKLALEDIERLDNAEDRNEYIEELLNLLYDEGKLDDFLKHIYDNDIKELVEPIEELMRAKAVLHEGHEEDEEVDEENEVDEDEEFRELRLQEKRIELNLKHAGLKEEILRMENQIEDYEVSSETANSEIFKFAKTRTETLIYTFKELINNGCTYDNALAVAKDILDGYDNLTKIKLGAVQSSQNNI